ncbi:MAG: helix-turn-helix domain-containing protein [Prevotella sp.]|jgi:AraC-like DNA-binding protein
MELKAGVQLYNYMETFYCCTVDSAQEFESVVSEHMLVYVISGELDVLFHDRRRHLQRGQAYLIRKNFKAHKIEYPSRDGQPFKGLFLQLKAPMLKKVMREYHLSNDTGKRFSSQSPYIMLPDHPLLKGMFRSLESYFDSGQYPSKILMEAKIKEVILTLIETMPELKSVLFDFANPWKVDLGEYMEENFANDLDLEGFAHYAGRSLSAFKKDFISRFHISPGRWIVKRRLAEACRLMHDRGEKPMEVYLKVGFKNLSHFSTAFKREYGITPTEFISQRTA